MLNYEAEYQVSLHRVDRARAREAEESEDELQLQLLLFDTMCTQPRPSILDTLLKRKRYRMYTEEVNRIREKIKCKATNLQRAQQAKRASRSALHRMDTLNAVRGQLAQRLQNEEPSQLHIAQTELLYAACMAAFLVALATCVWFWHGR